MPRTPAERFPKDFRHLLEFPMKTPADLVRWRWEATTDRRWRAVPRRAPVPVVPNDGAALAAPVGGLGVTWIGHASFVVRIGRATLLVDPVWSPRLPGGMERNVPPGVAWEALPRIDAVLLTHNHYDHLDAATVKRLPRGTPCLVPANEGPRFRAWGFTDVREFLWWDDDAVAGARATFVPAAHWSRRGLADENRSLWGGWVVEADGRRVYLAGDTGPTSAFPEIARRFPKPDVAVLPIGAYEPRWFMGAHHLTPEEAGAAWETLGARAFVPCHWGTFKLASEPLDEPPARLAAWWKERGHDLGRLAVLPVGGTWTVAP